MTLRIAGSFRFFVLQTTKVQSLSFSVNFLRIPGWTALNAIIIPIIVAHSSLDGQANSLTFSTSQVIGSTTSCQNVKFIPSVAINIPAISAHASFIVFHIDFNVSDGFNFSFVLANFPEPSKILNDFHAIWFQIFNAHKNAAVSRFSLVNGFKFRESNDVHFNAAWTVLLALLKIVPSSNNHGASTPNFATFHAVFNERYPLFVNKAIFLILFAVFIHLAALAHVAHTRNNQAIAAAHIHPVATAIATVIAISTNISHIIFAFSSLRSNAQYHTISL